MDLILLVDDDEDVAKTIEMNLSQSGYQVIWASSGYEALQKSRRHTPNLVLLDIGMPDMDGIEVCRRLRANPASAAIPILFLTASGGIESKIAGFNAGADDYLVKPFDLQELNLRVKALLRRGKSPNAPSILTSGPLSLDCHTFDLTLENKTVLLTPVEFELLYFLMSHAGQVFSAEQLLSEVWQYPPGTGSPELVRTHIKNLRNKIEPNPKDPLFIKTAGRFGYTLKTHPK
jgi:two-component system, OmpR family, response regulator RpaA